MTRCSVVKLVVVLCSSSAAVGQTVWPVSASNGVQAAINASAPGDIIDLTGPFYTSFLVNKGVSIRGNGAVVGTIGTAPPGSVTLSVPAGQIAHVDQLNTTTVNIQGGSVRIERSAMRELVANNADLVIVDCQVSSAVLGPPPLAGLWATASTVSMRDSTFEGSHAGLFAGGPFGASAFGSSPAVTAVGGAVRIHAERCTFVGGYGAAFNSAQGPVAFAPSQAVVGSFAQGSFADCSLRGGDGHGAFLFFPAAPGAPAHTSSGFEYRDTLLISGGPSSTSVTMTNAQLATMELIPVWTRGTTSTMLLEGQPNELHAVFVTPALNAQSVPIVVDPVYVGGEFVVFLGINDASGIATYPVAVPNVPTLQHAPFWCQAVGGITLPLRASVLAGGLVR